MNGRRSVGIVAFFVTFLTVASLLAAPSSATQASRDWLRPSINHTANGPAPVQASLGKWVAIALLVGFSGFAWWKRKQQRQSTPVAVASQIKVSGVTKLSPKARLIVVSVNGRSMLLGVTEASVNRLMWLDEAEEDENERLSDLGRGSLPEESDLRSAPDNHTSQLGSRRIANAVVEKPLPTARPNTLAKQQPSRFRELLSDAIGLVPKPTPGDLSPKAPVDELLQAAQDRYVGRDISRGSGRASQKARQAPLIDVEGQAAGLIARLNRPIS